MYLVLEFSGEFSQRLSVIVIYLQSGYWRREPEPGACACFVRVMSFGVIRTPWVALV